MSKDVTLRDYFAGQALIGLLSVSLELCRLNKWKKISKKDMANNCYIYADAMLVARRKACC